MSRSIAVSSKVEGSFAPDCVEVDISIDGQFETREACAARYNELLASVKTALNLQGVPSSLLKNGRYAVSPRVERLYRRNDFDDYYVAKTRLEGYELNADLSLNMDVREGVVTSIWKALSSCGDEVTFAVRFTLANKDEIKDGLLADAVAASRKKAEVIAEAAGAKMVGIENAKYNFDSGHDWMCCEAPGFYDGEGAAPEFNPEDVSVSCCVEVTWEIELL